MTFSSVFHIALAETKRNLWFVSAFWLYAFTWPEDPEGLVLLGFVIIARLAQGDHITRPTALNQRLPVSQGTWTASRITLLLVWIVLPLLIKQGWVAHHTLLSPSSTAWLLFETGITSFLFASAALAVTSLPQSWRTSIPTAIVAALLLYIVLWFFYDLVDLPSPNYVHNTQYKYKEAAPQFLWLAFPFSTILFWGFLSFHRKRFRYAASASFLAVIVVTSSVVIIHGYGSLPEPNRKESPESIALTKNESEGPNQQIVHKSIKVTGLKPGTFVTYRKLMARGSKRAIYAGDYGANRQASLSALESSLAPGNQLFEMSGNQFYTPGRILLYASGNSDFEKAFEEESAANSLLGIQVDGDLRKWTKILEMPLENGTSRSHLDISARLETLENDTADGVWECKLTLYRPALTLSPNPKQNLLPAGWGGIGDAVIIFHNAELEEYVIPAKQQESSNSISRVELKELILRIPPAEAWKIFWPAEEATARWLEGSTLQIYTTEYLGSFSDEIYVKEEEPQS